MRSINIILWLVFILKSNLVEDGESYISYSIMQKCMSRDWIKFYFYKGPSFIGSDKSFDEAVYVSFGVPFDNTASYRPGSRFAPLYLRLLSEYLELPREGLISLCDLGDLPPTNSLELMLKRVSESVKRICEEGKIPVILGGEHTLTLASAQAIEDVDVLVVFDAHLDMRDEFMDTKLNHTTWLRRLIERKKFERLIVIGARAYLDEELDYARGNGIEVITSREVFLDFYGSMKKIRTLLSGSRKGYISLDIDVLDPGYAPGVSNPEPGGLTPIHFFQLVEAIAENLMLRGIDLVEVNPLFDNGVAAANGIYAVYYALLASATTTSS